MTATKVLKAEARDRVGKGAARALRRQKKVPAVIYGGKQPPVGIALDGNEMYMLLHAGGFMTTLFDIDVGGKIEKAIPRDYQLDPVKDFLTHVDFLRITGDSTITVDVPVQFLNEAASPGLKSGGVLNVVQHTIQLAVKATDIPKAIEIDLAGLDIGAAIHIEGIKLPAGAKPVDRDNFTIATIVAPTVQEEKPAAASAPEGDAKPADAKAAEAKKPEEKK